MVRFWNTAKGNPWIRRKGPELLATKAIELGFELYHPLFGGLSGFVLFLPVHEPESGSRVVEAEASIVPAEIEVQGGAVAPYHAISLVAQLEAMVLGVFQVFAHQRLPV